MPYFFNVSIEGWSDLCKDTSLFKVDQTYTCKTFGAV